MSHTRTCGRCGAIVPGNAPDQLCLRCLFDTAVDGDETNAFGTPLATGSGPGPNSIGPIKPSPIFGDYELLGELGRGGQGVVYRARHRSLGRLVALKTIPPAHLANTHARERFRLEASTASRLDHPNIVPIFEVGERDGFCFYSMKLIEGATIQQLVADGVPEIAAIRHIAAVLLKVAHAVHHAHQRGVLHRDLKPSNILLDLEDEPHVSDFGLARQTDEDSSLTLSQALIGTPAYLAPEVATGGTRQATVAADIYGLGAILYQLLTAQPPFVRATIAATLRAVQDEEPIRPAKLNRAIAADLETICLTCLEKEPAKRYGTAEALAADLARFVRNEPIHARPITRIERAWRWCRRKPAFAGSLGAAVVLLLAILIGSPLALYRISRARQGEQAQLQRAEAESLKARQFAYASDMNFAHQAVEEDDFYRALQLLDRHRPEQQELVGRDQRSVSEYPSSDSSYVMQKSAFAPDLRGWEWRYLWRRCQGEERFILGEHIGGASAIGLLADGKTVFSAGSDNGVRVWDLESRRQIGQLPHPEAVIGAAASPDGQWLATAMEKDAEGQPILLWNLTTRALAATLNTTTVNFTNFWLRTGSITFSPDSKWLAFGTMWGGVRLWNVESRSEVANLPATNTANWRLGLAFSPDSRTLAYNENDFGAILLCDITSRATSRLIGHESAVSAIAFSPDGHTLASGSQDGTARLWNLADERARLLGFTNRSGGFTSLAFSPDGRTLALSGDGAAARVIRLVDVATGGQNAELRGHLRDVSSLAFTPDGQTLLSASADGTVRAWDRAPRAKEESVHMFARNSISLAWPSYGPGLCLSPNGLHLLTVYSNQTFSIWDTLRLAEGKPQPLPFTNTTMAALASGGRLAAFGSRSGEIMLWEAGTSEARFFAQFGSNQIRRLVFSLDGHYLAAADEFKKPEEMTGSTYDLRRSLRVWDLSARKELRVLSPQGAFLWPLAFTPDSQTLIGGSWDGLIKIWQLDGPAEGATLPVHSGIVRGLVSRPDGKALISAGSDIRFWDVDARRENALRLKPRSSSFSSLALSPDGRRLAAGADDGRITLWDMASRQEVGTLAGHKDEITQLAFTPDGNHLVSASQDQLHVWRAASPAEIDAPARLKRLNPR